MQRKLITIIILVLTVYTLTSIFQSSGLMAYIFPSACWGILALVALKASGSEQIRFWTNKRITFMALLAAVFQIFILVDAGLLNKFGNSPLSFTPTGIATNFMLVSSTLLGMELSRAYIAKNLSHKRPFLILGLITVLYTFINVSILGLTSFQDALAYTKFIGENFLPALTENLLATYLAMISGPLASLAYRAPLQAFQWFSPILPDLSWGYKALIGVMIPTIGFIAINITTTQKDFKKAGIQTRKELTPKIRKSQKSTKGWLAISVFLVIAVWTSTGLFGFYPTVIASGSMTPMINVGDIAITVSTDSSKIQVGDIIQYWQNNEMILHRVIEINQGAGETEFITKGDANTVADPDPVYSNQIRGKLIFTIPKLGWVSITIKDFIFNTYAFLTTTLPQTLTNVGSLILTNGVYITSALAFTSYSYLLLTYKNLKKEEKPK